MEIPDLFQQSNQVLRTDSFWIASRKLVVLVAASLLVGGWLFFGSLTFYSESRQLNFLVDDLVVRATFDAEQVMDVKIKESATIQYRVDSDEIMDAPAIVVDIRAISAEQTELDLLLVDSADYYAIIEDDTMIQSARIVLESVTPVRLIFTNAGLTQ